MIALQCPQCMAPLNPNSKVCEYCQSEIFVSSIAYLSTKDNSTVSRYLSVYQDMLNENPRNIEANMGIGVCFLIRGLYKESIKYFTTVNQIDLSCAHAYYYRVLCEISDLPYEKLDIKIILEQLKYLKLAYDIDHQIHFVFLIQKIVNRFFIANYLRAPLIVRDVHILNIDKSSINENELSKINDLLKF